MEDKKKIERQAVVVIHGIGEQRPMETLRDFVYSVRKQLLKGNGKAEAGSTLRSKPDSIGDIYETNRLSLDQNYSRPKTDFYEFYWAHNMRNTRLLHMSTWVYHLIFPGKRKLPSRLSDIFWTVWGLIIVITVGILTVGILYNKKWAALGAAISGILLLPALLSLAGSMLKRMFFTTAGDAARYFTPTPDNVGERSNIRRQGIEFLRKLHTLSSSGKVDRIIIVAHSLGSVIAYDLLRLLWTEYNKATKLPASDGQPALQLVEKYACEFRLPDIPDKNAEGTTPEHIWEDHKVVRFQKAQYRCWQEQRSLKNPWLVTDFITIGAALHAIDYFMVSDQNINTMIRERELPVCPPAEDKKDEAISYGMEIKDGTETVNVLNHGAMFGVMRWTNLYFRKDFVGGDCKRIYGQGVRDIELANSGPWFYPVEHTNYWSEKGSDHSLAQLVKAMKLNHAVTYDVEIAVHGPIAGIWQRWTEPDHIKCWFLPGPGYVFKGLQGEMSAGKQLLFNLRDGQTSTSFTCTVSELELHRYIIIILADDTILTIKFEESGGVVHIRLNFDTESYEYYKKRAGVARVILESFKNYCESQGTA